MILTLHITIALTSLVATALAFASPSRAKLRASYGLVALTLVTGTYLVATRPAHLAEACSVGLIYLGISFAGIMAARHKFGLAHGA